MGNREDSHTTDHSMPSKKESRATSNLPFTEKDLDSKLQQVMTFIDQLEKIGRKNAEETGRDFTEHIVLAHRLALAGIISMLRRHEKAPVRTQLEKVEPLTNRLVLVISFVQGSYHCYEAIAKGLYVQAAALLRQEMETVAALVDARKSVGNDRRARPKNKGQQVGKGNIAWGMNRLHGGLSSATHLTDPKLLDGLYRTDARPDKNLLGRPVRLMPVYRKVDAINLFAFQAGLTIQLGRELDLLFEELVGNGANALENYCLSTAFEYLKKDGFLIETSL